MIYMLGKTKTKTKTKTKQKKEEEEKKGNPPGSICFKPST